MILYVCYVFLVTLRAIGRRTESTGIAALFHRTGAHNKCFEGDVQEAGKLTEVVYIRKAFSAEPVIDGFRRETHRLCERMDGISGTFDHSLDLASGQFFVRVRYGSVHCLSSRQITRV